MKKLPLIRTIDPNFQRDIQVLGGSSQDLDTQVVTNYDDQFRPLRSRVVPDPSLHGL